MTVTATTTVAELATAAPATIAVFQRHGIDFCCGGKRPLLDVCAERGLVCDALIAELHAATAAPAPARLTWDQRPLAELTAHIVESFHDPLREELPRLIAMARTMVTIGMSVLALMLAATVLTVVFATRGAMAGSGHIIDVLHFVGAEARFIAIQFRRHFLVTGAKGAAAGGFAAILTFIGFSWWSSMNLATPEADQATALFGNFAIGTSGYAGVAFVVLAIAGITALTSHLTVIAYLTDIDSRQPDGG